jgi:hypothetical protein
MSNFTSKKTKTINSNSLIKNQITNILQPVNGTIAITKPTNTILTQNAVSQNYYIPLLETINGEQSINVKAPLSFNATTNTLSVPNLTTSNLPTCNVDASNSSHLVNKSYANTYAYFDLSAGDRWYCEDWITNNKKGIFNWDTSGSMSMITGVNHIGIVSMSVTNNNGTYNQIALPIPYSARNMKSIRFIVRQDRSGSIYAGFKESLQTRNNDFYTIQHIYWQIQSAGSYVSYTVNGVFSDSDQSPSRTRFRTSTAESIWWLVEISIDKNGYVSLYLKNLSSNSTTIKCIHPTPVDFTGYIFVGNIGYTSQTRAGWIDYIDWVVSS